MNGSPIAIDQRAGSRARYYLTYTVLFCVMVPLVFLCFLQNGRLFMWKPDSLSYYSTLKELGSQPFFAPGFTFQKGLGRGFQELEVLRAVFYPVYLLAYIWPRDRFESLYTLRVLLGFYLAGFSFSVFARKFRRDTLPVLAGAMTYAFSGYMLFYGVRHPAFSETIAFLNPLLLLAIEKVLRKESWLPLAAIVFYFSLEALNLLYAATLLAAVFFIVRFLTADLFAGRRRFSVFLQYVGRTAAAYLLGMLMSTVAWLPLLQIYAGNGRIGKPLSGSLLLFPRAQYRELLQYAFAGYKQVLGFPATAFLALCALLARRGGPDRRSLKWLWAAGTLCLCLPLFGYACSGFSNVTNRWNIGYTLILALAVMVFTAEGGNLTGRQLLWSGLSFAAYAALCLFWKSGLSVALGLGMIAAVWLAALLFHRLRSESARRSAGAVFLSLTCLSLVLNAYMLYAPAGSDYQAAFLLRGEADAAYMGNSLEGIAAYLAENGDPGFFRVAANDTTSLSTNAAMAYDLNGVAEFNSEEMSYTAYLVDNDSAGVQDITAKNGMDNRTAMMELASVKYYAAPAGTRYAVPYGYLLAETVTTGSGDYDVYVNQLPLSLGCTYGAYITREDYDALSVPDRQNALLQAVLLEEETELLPRADGLLLTCEENTVLSAEYDNVAWKDGVFKVGKGGGSITYTFDPLPGELYIHIQGMHLENKTSAWTVDADTSRSHASAYYRGDDYTYYASPDKLLNLGCDAGQEGTVTLTFSRKGTFSLDSIRILTQPMEDYARQVSALAEEAPEHVQIGQDKITAEVTVSGERILCLAIPYSSAAGWTAYVDGERTALFRANDVYTGLALSPGSHSIQLQYRSPLLREYALVSLLGAAAFAVLWIRGEKKRRAGGVPAA